MRNCLLILVSEADEMLNCLVAVLAVSHIKSQILVGKCIIRIFSLRRRFVSLWMEVYLHPLCSEFQHREMGCPQYLNKYLFSISLLLLYFVHFLYKIMWTHSLLATGEGKQSYALYCSGNL